eukprot:CAMPEP_0177599770 /NCGR_PEP_ID=MMETSP0419_2-20121207/13197_1 /TAXON_ID=582737 /ORGANISM="Tetraselmis sp., Strain GSL018" /LENGTH=215 /DNA_ID=CAMNT_0019092579 /DNA_START=227 /DNA_END=874 /DNA_ORIENTATION=-
MTPARVSRPAARRVTCMAANTGNWLPGSPKPAYLDGLAGNYGFDPLKLGKTPTNLSRFRESEIIHCRWAMLGVAGSLAVEVLGLGDWYSAPNWALEGGSPTWFGQTIPFDLNTLLVIEFVLMAGVEVLRGTESDAEKRCYPGGAFDPLGWSKDASKFEELKLKEIKNGRLAMMAFLGFVAQHAAVGGTPLSNLADHLADPGNVTFASNGVSVPFL